LIGQKKEQRGAGEILFTSMDNDGTKNGFANEALSKLSSVVNIPIIASVLVTYNILLIALQ
jgi:cyclase